MSSRRLQITLQPDVLRWARERAKLQPDELANKMGVKDPERVLKWERDGKISVAQVDKLAKCTYTPLGYLYSKQPPDDRLPITDFRTREGTPPPSPDLLETVYLMQRRQAWMRDDLIKAGVEPLDFVGAYGLDSQPQNVASAMRKALQLTDGWADTQNTWRDALRLIQDRLDATGVLVCFNSVVGNNSRRKLDPNEFQGFALADEYAPLVFVNSADFRAAQMFTLAHELAHLLIAKSGVSTFQVLQPDSDVTEQFCDEAAAEFLVPAEEFRAFWSRSATNNPFQAITSKFMVSSIVAARRAHDLKLISTDTFFNFYRVNADEWEGNQPREDDGGNFWNTQKWRIGPRFATAIVRAVKEERMLYREAYNFTGLRGDTFEDMPEKLGVPI
ncbi:MAG: XRE family transcriptional regulator [Candidatus Poribacteria bacterium]|nr:XRE family transcriptional regulator [Candidatus Poribacteria bacterium]MDE0502494.1 XRE family transcriptional regulator [Candidatus Poribacteria bacterium]